jgi:hypothetical protein
VVKVGRRSGEGEVGRRKRRRGREEEAEERSGEGEVGQKTTEVGQKVW